MTEQNEQTKVEQLNKLLNELQLVTPIDLAKEVKVPPQQVYGYIRDGRISHVMVGGHKYVTRRTADEWKAKRAKKAQEKVEAQAQKSA
jgi:hypothetical protein